MHTTFIIPGAWCHRRRCGTTHSWPAWLVCMHIYTSRSEVSQGFGAFESQEFEPLLWGIGDETESAMEWMP